MWQQNSGFELHQWQTFLNVFRILKTNSRSKSAFSRCRVSFSAFRRFFCSIFFFKFDFFSNQMEYSGLSFKCLANVLKFTHLFIKLYNKPKLVSNLKISKTMTSPSLTCKRSIFFSIYVRWHRAYGWSRLQVTSWHYTAIFFSKILDCCI